MAKLEREFHRSFRGPEAGDEDEWRLVFDPAAKSLCVRRTWRTKKHSGVEEFSLEEILVQEGAVRDALVATLFDRATVDA